jgi:3-methylfumaryl-CoA hydratase
MSEPTHEYADWIGRTEQIEEEISLTPVLEAAATLDDSERQFGAGSPLPPLWHWFYFLPRVPQSSLGSDGHPPRGGFMPPIPYPRRMFAGSRLRFHRLLRIGQPARREGEIRSISQKTGRSGALAFVTVVYRFVQGGELCIEEEQDIVYREPGPPLPAPQPTELPPPPEGAWSRTITPDPRLLFRFSALTFNAHRIHYDRPYAMHEEGYPGLIVHGPLTAILMLELVRQHTARAISGFSFRGQTPLFDLAPFRLVGVPSAEQVALEAHAPDGKTALVATAELAAAQHEPG